MKNYKAVIFNETKGREWLGTFEQERPSIGKDFIKNALAFAFNEMGIGCCDCETVTVRIGTGGGVEGEGMNGILDILLSTRVEDFGIYVDVRYVCKSGLYYVREMVMAE